MGPVDSLPIGWTVGVMIYFTGEVSGCKLMLDEKDFGYSFPCDGPGRQEGKQNQGDFPKVNN